MARRRVVSIFDGDSIFILKVNPWARRRGKFRSIVNEGLVDLKKGAYILATPPPWFGNKNALSPAQREVNRIFADIQRRYAGLPLKERIKATKQALTGRKFAVARAPRPERPVVEVPATPARRAIQEVTE
jgi:hypothetical protein